MRAIIVGGGAAGLYLSTLVPDSIIVERNTLCGKKLRATGGGRCNFTHASPVQELLAHYNGSLPFIRKVLYSHTPEDIIRHMEQLGIRSKTEDDGRVFPCTDNAEDAVMALTPDEGRIIIGREVIRADKNGDLFNVYLDNGAVLQSPALVIASGCSASAPGYSGSGYSILSSFGHTITPRRPALAPLRTERNLREAEGVSISIRVRYGRKTAEGEAVITHDGISGPVILNISRDIADGEEIILSFSDADMKELRVKDPRKLVKNAIDLPERLLRALIGNTLMDKKVGNLSKSEERTITEEISSFRTKAWPMKRNAMTEAGGALLSQFNPETMESKLVPRLYAAGDVLDADADTGGYNLTWAFATAWCISQSLMI